MAMKIPKIGLPQMLKEGYTHASGLEEAVYRNIHATKELTEITRTSLGPNGRNKMVINHLEKLFVTNDAATIMKELDVVHPAAKMVIFITSKEKGCFSLSTTGARSGRWN
jgi:T-complex protein 1 subunit theta